MFGAFKVKLASILGALWIRSLRIRQSAPEGYGPGVIGVWHKDLLACCAAFKDSGAHVLVSASGDGEIFARVTSAFGYRVTRGSDSRGATNVRHLRKTLDKGGFVAMAPWPWMVPVVRHCKSSPAPSGLPVRRGARCG